MFKLINEFLIPDDQGNPAFGHICLAFSARRPITFQVSNSLKQRSNPCVVIKRSTLLQQCCDETRTPHPQAPLILFSKSQTEKCIKLSEQTNSTSSTSFGFRRLLNTSQGSVNSACCVIVVWPKSVKFACKSGENAVLSAYC